MHQPFHIEELYGADASLTRLERPPGLPDWAPALFMRPLQPLTRPRDGGKVWAIGGSHTTATISDQFKANAEDYHRRYSASAQFEALFRNALAATGIDPPAAPLILDLGSGSGVNSIVPCLRLFPQARLVATDLSSELLGILAHDLQGGDAEAQVTCVVMDAMGQELAPARFDLVTGASILHHLPWPQLGVEAAARALKPGGHAIFLEPFDGYAIIRLAYERILAEAALRGARLHPEIALAMERAVLDIALRVQPDTSDPAFQDLDDKWLFSRAQFEAWGAAAGFEDIRFVPHNDHTTLYRDIAAVNLHLGTGLDAGALLPAWAIAILDGFDAAVSLQMKRQIMLEGSIIMTKAA